MGTKDEWLMVLFHFTLLIAVILFFIGITSCATQKKIMVKCHETPDATWICEEMP